MHVIIVGNGIAGINVASALSAREGVSVEIFAGEQYAFYSRVRLPEVLSGAVLPEAITFYESGWYEKKKIAVRTSLSVTRIDRKEKKIYLADGTSSAYDYLVLATGASANRPSIPGAGGTGIHTMRTMNDVLSIRSSLKKNPGLAAVIGGGLLGLEAARALKDAGAENVRVLEIAGRLLPRQLDETGASILQKRFEAMGIEILCGVELERFQEGVNGGPHSIILKDSRTFMSGVTILSMGIHSNIELAKDASLTINRGIIVDSRMRTDDPFIFASGDCAEFGGIIWGIIPAALEQAVICAKAILASGGYIPLDTVPEYMQTVPKMALKVGGVDMLSLGKAVPDVDEISSGTCLVKSRVWDETGRYEKYVLSSDGMSSSQSKLIGAILLGSKKNQGAVQKLLGKEVSAADIDALLNGVS